uniref:Cadherin domain-containing protein n=1 Tax=Meloidogyne incognita TaxID=6306 RepID=A0A914ML60_MELIC
MGWSKGVDLLVLPIIGIPFGDKQNIKLNILNGQQFVSLNNSNKQLILKSEIDRDTLNINVFISIIDVNDNPPKFTRNGKFNINLHEELPIGTKINLDFKAIDNDQPGPNSHIRYKIIETISSSLSANNKNYSNLFSIPDPFLPELFISDRIDFENMPSNFSIKIEAEDQGTPKLNSSAVIEVNLVDIDDLNPIFSSTIYKAKKSNFNSTLLIIEPRPIKAWDGDRINETILYKLSGENSKYFIIDEFNGIIQTKTNSKLPSSAQLIVNAFQSTRAERNSTAFVLFENNYSEEEIEISLIHIISFICFLLILSNFLILSFWLGERKKQFLIKNKMFVF